MRPDLKFIPSRHGSAMMEYAALIAIVAAALISMAVYIKRAVSGKYREVGDAFGHGEQFEPGVTTDQTGTVVP